MRKGTVAALIWQALMGIVSPIWCTFIFYFITGNGKGFGYDLRDEKIVYIYARHIYSCCCACICLSD